jgi:hypothetical protein
MSLFMFFRRTDNLPSTLTSYDLLKFATVIFMLVAHLGAFFFLDETWWRVLGRLGFPAWFFLAGYSRGKEVGQTLWVGALLLVSANMVLGQYMLPANALVSYIAIRIFMTPSYKKCFSNWEILIYASVALVFLSVPTNFMFEYGTMAFLFAMFGYAVRNKDDLGVSNPVRVAFCIFTVLVVGGMQTLLFGMDIIQSIVCMIEFIAVGFILFNFKSLEFPKITAALPNAVNDVIRFGGRYTLEIYVFHLIAIKMYLLYANYGFYKWFTPTMFPAFPTH